MLEHGVEALHGQAHHVEVAAAQFLHCHEAEPLLNAVGTCFVKRQIVVNVIIYLVLRDICKLHVARHGETLLLHLREHRYARDDLMHAAAQLAQYGLGIFRTVGLTHHHAVETDNGIGGDEQFLRRHRTFIGFRLFAGYVKGDVFAAQVFGKTFVNAEERAHFER